MTRICGEHFPEVEAFEAQLRSFRLTSGEAAGTRSMARGSQTPKNSVLADDGYEHRFRHLALLIKLGLLNDSRFATEEYAPSTLGPHNPAVAARATPPSNAAAAGLLTTPPRAESLSPRSAAGAPR
jgi:hypothetical protein